MSHDIANAEKIIVNSSHLETLPGILIFFADSVVQIPVDQIRIMLQALHELVEDKRIKVTDATHDYIIFIPIGEEKRDAPVCKECGSICARSENGYTCLNCGWVQ